MEFSFSSIIFFSLFTLFLIHCLRYYWKCITGPPGPWGIPILGTLPMIMLRNTWPFSSTPKIKIPITLYRHLLGEKYRKHGYYASYIGTQRVIILQTYDAIKETIIDQGELFSGRPQTKVLHRATLGYGLIFNSNKIWKEARRFSLTTLRNFGLGKSILEEKIQLEAIELTSVFQENVGKELNSCDALVPAVANIVCQIIFGERSGYQDPAFLHYVDLVKQATQIQGVLGIMEFFFPKLSENPLLDGLFENTPFQTSFRKLRLNIRNKIEVIWHKYDGVSDPNTYVESFIKEYGGGRSSVTADQKHHSRLLDNCSRCAQDLFIGGTDTTVVGLTWALLYLSIYPQIQQELADELFSITHGDANFVFSLNHRLSLPYTLAFIDEVQRFGTIIPLSVDRSVMHPVEFRGTIFLPSDVILSNIYAVHHDSQLWTDPDCFQPERFLTNSNEKNGERIYQSSKHLIPFGVGKRQCLGESLAKMEFFILLCSIVNRFEVKLATKYRENLPQILLGRDGLIHTPGDHRVIFTSRTAPVA